MTDFGPSDAIKLAEFPALHPDHRGNAEELWEWVQVLISAMISGIVGMDKHYFYTMIDP